MTADFELSFDRVEIQEGGRVRSLLPLDFIRLPVDERVRFVLTSALTFTFEGEPVDPFAALSELRKLSAAAH